MKNIVRLIGDNYIKSTDLEYIITQNLNHSLKSFTSDINNKIHVISPFNNIKNIGKFVQIKIINDISEYKPVDNYWQDSNIYETFPNNWNDHEYIINGNFNKFHLSLYKNNNEKYDIFSTRKKYHSIIKHIAKDGKLYYSGKTQDNMMYIKIPEIINGIWLGKGMKGISTSIIYCTNFNNMSGICIIDFINSDMIFCEISFDKIKTTINELK